MLELEGLSHFALKVKFTPTKKMKRSTRGLQNVLTGAYSGQMNIFTEIISAFERAVVQSNINY